jgi:hypothetical protein
VKGFWDLMTQVDEEQRQETLVPTPKLKGEVKNLECSINYDARGFSSNQGKARGPLL